MKNTRIIVLLLGWLLALSFSSSILAQRKMEKLGRGVVAIRTGTSSAFISWRLLGTEPKDIGFNLYRSANGGEATKLNSAVLTAGTNYSDNSLNASVDNAYFVKPVINGIEQEASDAYTLKANQTAEPCFVVPLKSGGQIHFVWVGDLDGDGEFDYVVDRLDYANANQKIEAYKSDGTYLWSVDFGTGLNLDNISPGPTVIDVGNWDGVTVYDMDSDGKAEVLIKSASGVTFGDGEKLTYSNPNVQFMSVLEGTTGKELARAEIPNNYLNVGPLACSVGIGYLNGITPSLVGFFKNRNSDGSFNRLQCAWDYDGTDLTLKWKTNLLFGASYSAHGADGHQMRIMDFDGDGKDEVGHIAFVLNGEDGSLMYDLGNSGIVHGDRWHVGKLDPHRPGLQGYGVQQDQYEGLIEYYYDAGTGEVLWKHSGVDIVDVGRGEAGDIDPRYSGYEVWSFSGQYNGPSNTKLSNTNPYPNFRIWWDGDLLSENLNDLKLEKWNYSSGTVSRVLTIYRYHGATQSARNAPMFYGDIMGDWREEMIYTTNDFSGLVVFTTDIPSDERIYTLPHNPEYRMGMTVKGYIQSHMLDYYLGAGMMTPPTPPIQTAKSVWKGDAANNIWDVTSSNWDINETQGVYTQGDDVMFDINGGSNTNVELTGTLTPSSIKVITGLDYSFHGTGTISGETGILKSGTGALTFNCSQEYTGTTRLEEGALYVNAQLSQSQIIAYMGATLGGNGTISQDIELNNATYITPGDKNSVGTLTIEKDLSLPTKCTVTFDMTDDSTNTVKPSDKLIVKGNLSVTKEITFVFNPVNGVILPGSYPLISYEGNFTGNTDNITIEGLAGLKYAINNSNGVISLDIASSRDASSITWNGTSKTWDLQTTAAWTLDNNNVTFVAGDTVIFNAEGAANSLVNIEGSLPVSNMLVDASVSNYSFSGSGEITGTGSLVKTGAGSLLMQTMNSYTGKTEINEGALFVKKLANAGESSSIGANTSVNPSDFAINDARLVFIGLENNQTDKGIAINGGADTIQIFRSSAILSVKGTIAGSGQLVKTGGGTLHLLNNNNTYRGGTLIKEGTVQLNDPGSYQTIGGLGSGTITLAGGTLSTGNTTSGTVFNNTINVPEGAEGTLLGDARCNYDGKLTGAGTLNIVLPGSIDRTIFRGNWSDFAGTIKVQGTPPMRLASSNGYGKATFDLASGINMYFSTGTSGGDATASNVHIGGVSGAADSYLDGENWYIGEANGTIEFAGVIRSNSLTKVGQGTFILTNSNTYSGGTKISSGKLVANNTTGSATGTGKVTIDANGTLDGTGIISGAIVVNRGGTLEFGEELGSLTVNNTITMSAGSFMKVDVNSTTGTCDKLKTGAKRMTLNGTLIVNNTSLTDFYAGSRFTIFTGSNIAGEFTDIIPATPGDGLEWDTSNLYDYGILKIKVATSVEENIESSDFYIYPNPVTDKLQIKLKEHTEITSVIIRNATGASCLYTMPNDNGVVDVANLHPGIYMIEIHTTNQILSKKFLKF